MAREHEQSGRDQFLSSLTNASEPGACNNPGTLGADIVTALSNLAKVINQGLQFGPFGGGQGCPVEFGGQVWSLAACGITGLLLG
jgi:hypothetical protein